MMDTLRFLTNVAEQTGRRGHYLRLLVVLASKLPEEGFGRIKQTWLAHHLHLSQGTISRLLGELIEDGHLDRRREGNDHYYRLARSRYNRAA